MARGTGHSVPSSKLDAITSPSYNPKAALVSIRGQVAHNLRNAAILCPSKYRKKAVSSHLTGCLT